MSPTEREPRGSAIKLLPHQTALMDAFFDPASKRIVLLRGDVGLGKSSALVALASRLLRERPASRALFLVPAALRSQFVEKLGDAGTPALLIDRYKFREMLDSTPEGDVWPGGVVVVLSREFAKDPDVRDSVAKTRWDLIIADEAHSLKGTLAGDLLRRVGASAERIVLATMPGLELPAVLSAEDATVVEWRRDRVVDHSGALLDALPRPLLQEVAFSLSPAELRLLETVGSLCQMFEAGTSQQRWIARLVLDSFQSSPAALERVLQGLAGGLNPQEDVDEPLESLEEGLPEDRLSGGIDLAAAETAGIVARALQEIEAVSTDSKLGAFDGVLGRLIEASPPSTRICVVTTYLGTLYYLTAEIERSGQECRLLRGGMSAEDRRRSLALFANAGGILVATRAAMTEDVTLGAVTDLVLYDIPGSKVALQEVLGRFDRFGRLSRLNVHVFASSHGTDRLTSQPLGLLREVLGIPAGVPPTL